MSDVYMRRFINNLENVSKKSDIIFSDLTLITTDTAGIITSVNLPFLNFSGYTFKECVGLKCNFLQLHGDKRNKRANMQVKHHLKHKLTIPFYVKFYNVTKNKKPFVFYCQIKPMISDNKIMGYYSMGSPLLELYKPFQMKSGRLELAIRRRLEKDEEYRRIKKI